MDEERKESGIDDTNTEETKNKTKKPPKGRRAYLADFTSNLNGEYVFTGDSYDVVGEYADRARKALAALGIAITIVTIILASVPFEGSIRCFYVVIPLAVQCIFVIRLAWIIGRIVVNKGPLRSYVYMKTVEKFDLTSWIVLIAAMLTSICWLVYTVLNGFGESIAASLGFVSLQALNIALIVAFKNLNNKIKWSLV